VLAAQLGKQLLEKNSALETRVETLEKESAELKERLEHISAQYLHASNVSEKKKKKKKKLA
jgi:chaperonin cofactor prefoldin